MVWIIGQHRREAVQAEQLKLRSSLALAAAATNRDLQDIDLALASIGRHLLVLDATHGDLHDADVSIQLREELIHQTAVLPSVVSMNVLDSQGMWAVSSQTLHPSPALLGGTLQLWNEAIRTPITRTFLMDAGSSDLWGMPSLAAGRVVRSSDGRILGVVVAYLLKRTLERPFSTLTAESISSVVSLPNGTELLSHPDMSPGIPDWLLAPWSHAVAQDGGNFEAVDDRGQRWLVTVLGTSNSLVVYTAMKPMAAILAGRAGFEAVVIATAAIGLLIACAMFGLWIRQRWMTHQKGISEWHAQHRFLETLTHDQATGFLNRPGLEEVLRDERREPREMLMLSINRLQAVSRSLTHQASERILAEMAERVRSVLDDDDVVGRLATEHFGIVRYGDGAEALARQLLHVLQPPYAFGERELALNASIGMARLARPGDWAQLIQDATSAMYRAREAGAGAHRWFESAADRPRQERVSIEQDLRRAIGTTQLYMMYQPICQLRQDAVTGFEALLRWHCPRRGQVPPDVFIPIAESTGLMLPIERMVARSPFDAAAQWPDQLALSINLPAYEFRDPSLPERVRDSIARTGIDPSRCYFEVTESALLEDDQVVISVMRQLKALGVKLALDDFGVGHASLGYLYRFPFDRIKIDKSFVQAMHKESMAADIVGAIVNLSHKLHFEVVAEGVETAEQLRQVKDMGCDYAQGFFIGHPLEESEVKHFLATRPGF
uniref:putative bifunctional diguanylate cyclase/phosphodiesterase n=1 Tax=Dyella soli TaxID=522319 RepID=UPI0013F437F4|nr:EAL domain-containing protein [Dyella soli]